MPILNRAPNERELQKLISVFLKAETDIINEIGRLRSQVLVDYHAVAALERVQAILRSMESDCWEYVPKMIEKQFYVRTPEARRITGETIRKHIFGYQNASALTGEQHAVVDQLVSNLMGEITDASLTVMSNLQSALIGRVEPDVYRRVGLEQVAAMQAARIPARAFFKELVFVKSYSSLLIARVAHHFVKGLSHTFSCPSGRCRCRRYH